MIDANFASFLILILTSVLLFYVAANDLRELKIRNELLIVLVVLFVAHAAVSGRWVQLHWNIAFAAAGFIFMLYWYGQGYMGGGDLKLLTVALLWTGIGCVLPFLIIMAGAALLHTLLGRLGLIQVQYAHNRMKVAFAPSIAAGLIGIFMLGCLHPMH
ncbi:prepilin peptidase [Bradyrhizobium erythrophlei]|uniref:prepilin peptidase n=1 Tax=Bradyrhizobium erythrophlei TaxID=1437360 RepID=UPI0035EFC0C1